ncbi:rhodanese-like domain-containing protein [Halobacillus litoralis]|uniref:rhodanese-like domain-containing protein n=1 Tax=Halobacillus litoralis TaxID=45668 RepID=UPI002490D613|nr:rhodanese-like domain-containing protein [Halobacillus litoralis]
MKTLTAKDVEKQLSQGITLNMIDVREDDEVTEGKIPGAKHIPLGSVEERSGELDQATPYIMICRSGGRSGRATQILEEKGFDVTNMEGGMMSWEGPTE